jgi:hypothetical protein
VISLAPGLVSEDSKQVAGYFGESSSEPVSFAARVEWKVVRGLIEVEGQQPIRDIVECCVSRHWRRRDDGSEEELLSVCWLWGCGGAKRWLETIP